MTEEFKIGGETITPGTNKSISVNVSRLYDLTEVNIPVKVMCGDLEGPRLFVSAALHGDELNGVEVIRRLLQLDLMKQLKGTLIAVPIVNVFGFNSKTRYLPDRRDLNRSFPGSASGSLTAQLAYKFMKEVVENCTHGIDLHTGAIHRTNIPQIRACLDEPEVMRMAKAFKVPVIMNMDIIPGSLRAAAKSKKIPMILYEGGEALRFDENSIISAVNGILSVMQEIGMLPRSNGNGAEDNDVYIAQSSFWVRAGQSGILNAHVKQGAHVEKGQILGTISDPYGKHVTNVKATRTGIVIGATRIPLLNRGDAVFHIASFKDPNAAEEISEFYDDDLDIMPGDFTDE